MNIVIKLTLAGALSFASLAAAAHAYKTGKMMIEHPWVRVTIPGRPGGGYMTVHNMGDQADKFLSATSSMAERVEIHTHIMKDGKMMMRRIEHVEVPAKGHVEFKPGGLHLMIFGMKNQIKPGDKLPLTLVFEKAGSVEMEVLVEGMGKMQMKQGNHSGHGASHHQ